MASFRPSAPALCFLFRPLKNVSESSVKTSWLQKRRLVENLWGNFVDIFGPFTSLKHTRNNPQGAGTNHFVFRGRFRGGKKNRPESRRESGFFVHRPRLSRTSATEASALCRQSDGALENLELKLLALRVSPPARPKPASPAKSTGYRDLSVRNYFHQGNVGACRSPEKDGVCRHALRGEDGGGFGGRGGEREEG